MKSAMKSMVGLQALLIVTFLSFACREASASQKKEGRITQVIQDVKLLPGSAAPRPAAVNDEVRLGTAVRTGQDSRTELTFSDQTLTRLGANSVFSFSGEGKAFDLGQGSILMQVPPNGSTATVKTAAVTAAISGGTALFGVGPPMKFMVLEGTGMFYPPGHPEGITLHGGEMITLTADGQLIGPTGFDVKKVLESAELLLPPFTDLANLWLIWQVITWQEADQTNGFKHSPKDPTEIETRDQAASSTPTPFESPTPTPATPTPTPTGTPAALKFGTPPTISSPVPYVVGSGTVINTDPTITTNSVIDEGRIYRNPTADGPRATWMFGSTSAFDTTSGFASGPDSVHMDNMAVFKFTSLQITGNPTVITTGDDAVDNLGLIGVNGITTSGGGETLTFDGVSMLLLATQNGSITLGGEFSFSGMDRMHIYARGTGSNLTIGSAITTNNDLRLYSEGTVQVNGDAGTINFSSFSGGDWLNGTGVINANGIYITSLGNITIDGQDLPDLIDGGGDISLRATNTLTVNVTGGTNTREHFDLFGATINLTSDTPVVLTLLATNPSINAGAGGIQASNVGLVGANLLLQSDGDINIYSVGVPSFIVDGTIDAGGLFNAIANVDTGFLSTGTSAFVGGDLSLSVAIIGTTLDVVGRLSASFVSAGGDVTVGTLAVLDLTTPGILTETTGGIHPLVFDNDDLDDGAAAQHTFTVASIVSPNGIDFSGNQFGGIDGFSSGGLLTINANTITFGDGGIASANFNGADAGAFDDEPFTPASGGNGGTFIVNATGNITTVLGADITATTGLNGPEDHGFSGNGGNVTLNSLGGTVTVDSLIQVSSNDFVSEGSEPIRRSASGGNITLHSGLTTGLGVVIGGNAQLLSLLHDNAPGPGGTILITTAGADIHMGEFDGAFLIADRGTIDIHQTAPGSVGTSMIEIYNTLLSAETISIASSGDFELGIEGFVVVDAVTLSLTAANDLDMQGFFDDATAVNSDGNVFISAGNNLTITDDLDITRRNGGRDSGVNITLSAGAAMSVTGSLFLTTNPDGLLDGGNILITASTINVTGDVFLTTYTLEDAGTGGNITVNGTLTTNTLNASVLVGQFFGRPSGPLGGFGETITLTSGGNITVTAPGGLNLSTGSFIPGSSLYISVADFGEILTGGNITLTVGTLLVPANLLSDAPFEMRIDTSGGSKFSGHIGTGANILATVHGNFTVSDLFVLIFNDGGSIDNGGTITLDIDGALATTTGDASFIIDHTDALSIPTQTAIDVSAGSITVAGNLHAFIDDSSGGGASGTTGTVDIHADGAINVTGALNVLGNVTSDTGDITAGTISSTNVTVTSLSPTAGIHAGTGGIRPFAIPGELFVNVLHTLTAPVVTSAGGINFNGVNADGDFSMATNAGSLTINANSLSIGDAPVAREPLVFGSGDIIGPVTFNGGDGSSTYDPASGGTFTVNTTGAIGDIDVNTDIEATTGHFQPALSATPAGFGGTVNLNSTNGTVTVNSRIEVSSAQPATTATPFRQSDKGGNIKITSGKIGGSAITVGSTAQLLSLLDTLATGGGGTIELSATGDGSSIDVNNAFGSIEADQGTIDINHHGTNGTINISNANMIADVIKIQLFGDNGVLTISGGTIDANSALTLYAAGSSGSIVFNADVTLSSSSAAIIAANTVTINDGFTVFIDSTNPALVYANVANYSATNGGNGLTTGSFGGPGAPTTTQPFPPPGPVIAGSAGSIGNNGGTSAPLVSSSISGGVALNASQPAAEGVAPHGAFMRTGLASKRLETASNLPRANRFMTASRTLAANTGGAGINTNNSAQLLSLLETAPDSGGKINFVPKPRSVSQKTAGPHTTRLNSTKVGSPHGNSRTISEPNATQTAPARNIGSGSGASTQVDNRTSSATTGRPGGALSY